MRFGDIRDWFQTVDLRFMAQKYPRLFGRDGIKYPPKPSGFQKHCDTFRSFVSGDIRARVLKIGISVDARNPQINTDNLVSNGIQRYR